MARAEQRAGFSSRSDDEIDLLSIFRVLGRSWRTIAVIAGLAVFLGGVYAYILATPVYRATSVVMLEARQSAGVGLESVLGALTSDNSTVNTEVQVLQSRRLLGRVVDALDLSEDPEFNERLRNPGLVTRLRMGLTGAEVEAYSPERLRDAVTSALLQHVAVRNVPNSLVFEIAITTTSPEKSARIADTLAMLYIEDQLQVRFDATTVATSWLTQQVADQKAAFEAADAEVRAFRSMTSVIDAETLAALDRQLKDMRRRIEQGEQQLRDLDQAIARLETDQPAADQPKRDRARVAEQVQALIEAEKSMVLDFDRQSAEWTQLAQLIRNADASRLLYEHFQTRLKETAAQQGINQADSRILSSAVIPSAAAAPRKSLILILSAMLGLMLGVGHVLLREIMANRIRSMNELEELTGRSVLSQVPKIPGKTRKETINYLMRNPASAPAEAIRNLRTALLFSSSATPPRVISLTSSVPGEGKTTTAVALAQNLTALGKKVLVIEGDVRMRMLGSFTEDTAQQGGGIVDILEGKLSMAEAARPVTGLGDVIFGDKSPTNAADLFSRPAFATLLAEAKAAYDMVLIDTPPVLAVPDVKIIAQQTDGILFVVRWDSTTREQVQEALHQLESLQLPILGLVLSNVDPAGLKKYGYGGYGSYGDRYYVSAGNNSA
ncbi:polysaccharide biosynthesis tyrosine autokinase [Paracoccus sp. IB05]|uniref:polysaccharide biosynthesis tyrosine autokinase n=1 Tax=Paracoccus sp. IB05 TaxID=2779367 RepID=UPI0018E8272A|nr:polysaccharide biosynthesis tyrosine autokinase [Paracoccus sp. IB05]